MTEKEEKFLTLYSKEAERSRSLVSLLYKAIDKGVQFKEDHKRAMTWEEQHEWIEGKMREL